MNIFDQTQFVKKIVKFTTVKSNELIRTLLFVFASGGDGSMDQELVLSNEAVASVGW